MPRKLKSLDQVERMQDKAVRFLRDVVLDSEKADEFEAMSPQEYAEHKGITIRDNPRSISMTDASKADLTNDLDDIQDILDDALDPQLSREEVIAKVKEAYDIASGEDEEEEEDESGNATEDDPGN